MRLTTVQWNIGGGKTRLLTDEATDESVYIHDNWNYFVKKIQKWNPDVIFLQEIQKEKREGAKGQGRILAEELGDFYCCEDFYDNSHINANSLLGQAILSRFPLDEHTFTFFKNPNAKIVRPNGELWQMHNKGLTKATTRLQNQKITLSTLHMFPFRRFNLDPMATDLETVRDDIDKKILSEDDFFLLQGDFNYNEGSLKNFIPQNFAAGLEENEITEPTTPKGRKYDRCLYRGFQPVHTIIDSDSLTDHFPVYREFSIPE